MRSRTWLVPILTAALARLASGCGDSGHSLGNARGGTGGSGGGAGGAVTLPDGGGADLPAGAGGARGGNGGAGAGTGGNMDAGGTGAGGRGSGGSGAGGTGTGGSGAGGAGGAAICSDVPSMPCPSGQICDLDTPNRCAAGFEPGHCIAPPSGCIAIFNPVCGCNAMTYASDCERQRARVQLDHTGACAAADAGADAGNGCAACNHSTDYCQITVGGVAGAPPQYACLPLPGACGASPSCACLTSVACSSVCAGSAGAGLSVTCFAP